MRNLAAQQPAKPETEAPTVGVGADPLGALRIGPTLLAQGRSDGPLNGITMVVKDLSDVAGVAIGAGNPPLRPADDWVPQTGMVNLAASFHAVGLLATKQLLLQGADLRI